MLKRLKTKSEFSKNVLTLMTGTAMAQALPIAISPILTRLYTPDDFGIFSLYVSVVTILSVLITGRYELAIMLPKKDNDAINIMALSLLITLLVSLMVTLTIFLFHDAIVALLGNPEIAPWLYLIPFSLVLVGVNKVATLWYNRKKHYKLMANNRVLQSASTAVTNLSFGLGALEGLGLIYGTLVGQLVANIYLIKNQYRADLSVATKTKIVALAKRYINFPKYDIIASLSSISAQQIIVILVAVYYGPAAAGFFYLTQRILGLPITFLSSAVLEVFKESASKNYKKYGNAKAIYKSTFKKLFLLSFVPTIVLFLFATDIFAFVFGEEWRISGEYAKILTPMLFLRFISGPLSFMVYIGEKQLFNLYSQLGLLLMVLFSFYLASTIVETIYMISISFAIFYILQLIISAKIAGLFGITNKDSTV